MVSDCSRDGGVARDFLTSMETGMVRMPKVPEGWFDDVSEFVGDNRLAMTNSHPANSPAASTAAKPPAPMPKNPIGSEIKFYR